MKLIHPMKAWLLFNALFMALVAASWYSVYKIAQADNERLVASQVVTLTKARLGDLEQRKFRSFVEGIGSQFNELYIQVKVGTDSFEFGKPPNKRHCANMACRLQDGEETIVTMCRPFQFSSSGMLIILLVYLIISGLSLGVVQKLEGRATLTLVEFLRASGVEVGPEKGLIGILSEIRSIRAQLDMARERERLLIDARARTELAEQVAHDIRSPLAALESGLEQLALLPEDRRGLVRHALDRIHDIAESLIKGARAQPRDKSDKTLRAQTEALIAEKRLQFRDFPGIEIIHDVGHAVGDLDADIEPVDLQRVLSNLINNAVEALDGKGKVVVATAGDGAWARITVSDDGKGIPADILARLGQRGSTFGKQTGTGLGLHHARTCVEARGGRFELESRQGVGTTVTLMLPLVSARGADAVLIDDDPLVRRTWQLAAKQAGKTVLVFAGSAPFFDTCSGLARSTPIYVDAEISATEHGEQVSKKIHAMGFSEVYLATGRKPDEFVRLSHLRGVVGKAPPPCLTSA